MSQVDFYFSIGSRYSYLAASQLERLQAETGCTVEWHPLNSVRLLADRKANPFSGEPISGQYDWSYRHRDAARWAELYGIPFVEPRGRVEFDPELLALACTSAKQLGYVEPFSRSLFSAMFSEAVSRIDEGECVRRYALLGLEVVEFERSLRSKATLAALDATMQRALSAGVFGVPTFLVSDALFWGNDRIVLLEHHLRRREMNGTG